MLIFLLLIGVCFANPIENNNANTRIIGGTDAPRGAYPFMVSLRYFDTKGHYCGGSILTDRSVLTAAHCVYNKEIANIKVHAATYDWKEDGDVYDVAQTIWHENYRHMRIGFDIGLIRVNRNFDFSNPLIARVYMDFGYAGGGTVVMSIGFGVTDLRKDSMQQLPLMTLSHEDCASRQYIKEEELCVYASPTQGVCYGDSGGPLLLIGTNRQVGIASRVGKKYCTQGVPDMFVRMDYFRQWIEDRI